jgi:hypothetical protein
MNHSMFARAAQMPRKDKSKTTNTSITINGNTSFTCVRAPPPPPIQFVETRPILSQVPVQRIIQRYY